MGYRNNIEPPKPEDLLPRFSIRNGATLRVLFRCYYFQWGQGHDPHYHDYINWPAPNYHGEACQMVSPRDQLPHDISNYVTTYVNPIDLEEEGYSQVDIAFSDSDLADYLTPTLSIVDDAVDGNYISMSIATEVPSFTGDPKTTEFTVFVTNSEKGNVDELIHGILVVLPGALPSSE